MLLNLGDCVRFLRKQANVLNLAIKVITLVPEKPVVVLTWIGSHPELPAILLNSHMDVVPVSEVIFQNNELGSNFCIKL